MKSNQRHIDNAKKKSRRNFDSHKLDYIQKNSKLNWLPDLLVKGTPEIILEHDTIKVHGELGYSNERTHKRNQDYAKTNRPFIIVNEDLAKLLKLDEAGLATYLYYHELEKWRAYQL